MGLSIENRPESATSSVKLSKPFSVKMVINTVTFEAGLGILAKVTIWLANIRLSLRPSGIRNFGPPAYLWQQKHNHG